MKNTKVLEMLNAGKIEELKAALAEEVRIDHIKGVLTRTELQATKARWAGMKRVVKYGDLRREGYGSPCQIDNTMIFFTPYAFSWIPEAGVNTLPEGLSLFDAEPKYLDMLKRVFNNFAPHVQAPQFWREIDFDAIFTDAKIEGYKFTPSQIYPYTQDARKPMYFVHMGNKYFNLHLIDLVYKAIQGTGSATVSISDFERSAGLYIATGYGYSYIAPCGIGKVTDPHIIEAADYYRGEAVEKIA